MPDDTALATGFRLRRSHEKSRSGCIRCKQQRKKCDELRPSCSRCTQRVYKCRYQNRPSDEYRSEQESTRLAAPGAHVPQSSTLVLPDSEPPFARSNERRSVPRSLSDGQNVSGTISSTEDERLGWDPHSPGTLDPTEIDLLGHYITHTSQIIPIDDLDLYALSVGVPNLAFHCRAVMSSLLALAAACKSHDIAKQTQAPLNDQNLTEIRELLALADRRHRASLRHIQAAMQNSKSYDYILANAALMVLYASASHSIRVHLAATAKQDGRRLPNDLYPQHSQWISFTRAAHTASTAVLKNIVDTADRGSGVTTQPDTRFDLPRAIGCSTGVLSPQDGPSEATKRLFLPLVASTYRRAVESLRRRAESTAELLKGSEPFVADSLPLNVFLKTVSVLEQCASAALSNKGKGENATDPLTHSTLSSETCEVSQWVARYMISVTSMQSPQVLRRIIMSFLNKAPAEFLTTVQSVLDTPSVEERADRWMTQDSPGSEVPPLDATHLQAMDIFAHWLVLVMLLDGVWWIGDIGQWELGQVMSLVRTQILQSVHPGETWWPESMYLVKRELTPMSHSDL
ncbi:hypothetical protein BDV25DRAFT_105005 [Aspergillus avenaceus]|uniref:Zn(2)-C6 fungal-type domain-containing protein n=1 Tax=Aspergillus avenaceus TaxID=36643 RepID=A0A5N6TX20_ASPAV|nr:hypothetical protein BDV25DRAFT_105005 [Aspergillus avenaceus]